MTIIESINVLSKIRKNPIKNQKKGRRSSKKVDSGKRDPQRCFKKITKNIEETENCYLLKIKRIKRKNGGIKKERPKTKVKNKKPNKKYEK